MSEVKCRILYVDDHEDSSEMFKLVLSESDYEVHTARTKDFQLWLGAWRCLSPALKMWKCDEKKANSQSCNQDNLDYRFGYQKLN